MAELDTAVILARYEKAKQRRGQWESLWRDSLDYTLPQRDAALDPTMAGPRRAERLFDATAADAVDQLAASLLAELTPPWSRWFALIPGPRVSEEDSAVFAARLEEAESSLQGQLDRSNFAVEMHQCYLDLVTVGTACLLFEEAPIGSPSAFRFTAVPIGELVLEEGLEGRLDVVFRKSRMTRAQLKSRFPSAALPDSALQDDEDRHHEVLEALLPEEDAYRYAAFLCGSDLRPESDALLAEGRFAHSPFISFRWSKAPGETYGRSPVLKALPDIKTANKVVELVLKNASIAVTGIWQADDDGVLNPAAVKLTPGTIIPKAVGSKGLTPLEPPGRFDVSELVLTDLRARIRHALLVDRLGQVQEPRMTATEVLERSAEMSRLLGATFGRLHAELLTPLMARAIAILARRGTIAALALDGQLLDWKCRAPLAQSQGRKDAQNVTLWLEQLAALGPDALAVADLAAAARWSADILGVPKALLRDANESGAEPTAATPALSLP